MRWSMSASRRAESRRGNRILLVRCEFGFDFYLIFPSTIFFISSAKKAPELTTRFHPST